MKHLVIKPPQSHTTIFLAGSIEMGTAIDWQKQLEEHLSEYVILNPRRDDWDSSWTQSIDNREFKSQVEWELSGIEKADVIAVYFDPATQSPVTLLELGIMSQRTPAKVIVYCPEGFWRKGNVDIICERYGIIQVDSFDELVVAIKHLAVSSPTQ
jgi:Nucleoside 2-deoxyribosyltransferase like